MGLDITKLRAEADNATKPSTKGIDIVKLRATEPDRVDPYAQGFNPGVMRNFDVNEFKFQPIYGSDSYLRRAQNQSWSEQLGKGLASTLVNIPVGIIRDLGYLGAFATEWGDERDYSNALTKWAESARNIGGWGEVYRTNPGKVWDPADSAWWLNNIFQTLESVGTFALEGYGIGSLLGKAGVSIGRGLASSRRLVRGVDAFNDIAKGAKDIAMFRNEWSAVRTPAAIAEARLGIMKTFMNTPVKAAHLANSFTLAYIEGAQIASDVYKEVYTKALEDNKDESSAKRLASESAAIAAQMNTSLIGITNLAVLAPISPMGFGNAGKLYSAAKGASNESIIADLTNLVNNPKARMSIFKPQSLKKLVALETGQEFIEEAVINNWAEYTGKYHGNVTPKTYKHDNDPWNKNDTPTNDYFEGLKDRIFSSQALLEGILGAFGGFGQSMVLGNRKTQDVLDASGNKIGKETRIKAENRRKQEVVNRILDNFQQDVAKINSVKEELQKLNDLSEEDQRSAVTAIKRDELLQQLSHPTMLQSVMNGTGDLLINTYTELQNTDNTIDLGIEAKQELTNTLDHLTSFNKTFENNKAAGFEANQEEIDKLAFLTKQHRDTIDHYNKVKGKTAAMVMGLALDTNDNNYKDKAKVSIQTIEKLNKRSEEIEAAYNFDMDAQLSGFAKLVYHTELERVHADLSATQIDQHMKIVEKEISDVLSGYGLAVSDIQHSLASMKIDAKLFQLFKIKQELKAGQLLDMDRIAKENERDRLQTEIDNSNNEHIVLNMQQYKKAISAIDNYKKSKLEQLLKLKEEYISNRTIADNKLAEMVSGETRKDIVDAWKKGIDNIEAETKSRNTQKQIIKIIDKAQGENAVDELNKLLPKLDMTDLAIKDTFDTMMKDALNQTEAEVVESEIKAEEVIAKEEVIQSADPISGVVIAPDVVSETIITEPVGEVVEKPTVINPTTVVIPGQSSLLTSALSMFDELASSINQSNTINDGKKEESEEQEQVLTDPDSEQTVMPAPISVHDRIMSFKTQKEYDENYNLDIENYIMPLLSKDSMGEETLEQIKELIKDIPQGDTVKSLLQERYGIAAATIGLPIDIIEKHFTSLAKVKKYYKNDTLALQAWTEYKIIRAIHQKQINKLIKESQQNPTESVDLSSELPGDFVFVKSAQAFGTILNLMSSSLGENIRFTIQDVISYLNADDPSGTVTRKYVNIIFDAAKNLRDNLADRVDDHPFYAELYDRFDFRTNNINLNEMPYWQAIDNIIVDPNFKQALSIFTAIVNEYDKGNYLPLNNFENGIHEVLTPEAKALITNMLYNKDFGKVVTVTTDKNYVVDDKRYSYDSTKDDSNMVPIAVIDNTTGIKIGQIVTIPYIVKGIVHMYNNYWFDIADTQDRIRDNYALLTELKMRGRFEKDANTKWDTLYKEFKDQYNVSRGGNAVNKYLDYNNVKDRNTIQKAIIHIAKIALYGSGLRSGESNIYDKATVQGNIDGWKDQVNSQILHARAIRSKILYNDFTTSIKTMHGGTIMLTGNVNIGKVQQFNNLATQIAVAKDGVVIEDETERIANMPIYCKKFNVKGVVFNADDPTDLIKIENTSSDFAGVSFVGIQNGFKEVKGKVIPNIIPMTLFNPQIKTQTDHQLYTDRIIDLIVHIFDNLSYSTSDMNAQLNRIIRPGSGNDLNFIFSNNETYGIDKVIQPTLELRFNEEDINGVLQIRAIKIIKMANGNIVVVYNDDSKPVDFTSTSRTYMPLKKGFKLGTQNFKNILHRAIGEQTRNAQYTVDGFAHPGRYPDFITNTTYNSYKEYLIKTNAIVTDIAAYSSNGVPISNVSAEGFINLRASIDMSNFNPVSNEEKTTDQPIDQPTPTTKKADDIATPLRTSDEESSSTLVTLADISTPFSEVSLTEEELKVVEELGGASFAYVFITEGNKQQVQDYINQNTNNIKAQTIALSGTSSFTVPNIKNVLFLRGDRKGLILHESVHSKIQMLTTEQYNQLTIASIPIVDHIKLRVDALGNDVPAEVKLWMTKITNSVEELYTYPFENKVIADWLKQQEYETVDGKEKSIFRKLVEAFLEIFGFEGSTLDKIINTLEEFVIDDINNVEINKSPAIGEENKSFDDYNQEFNDMGGLDITFSEDLTSITTQDIINMKLANNEIEAVCGF